MSVRKFCSNLSTAWRMRDFRMELQPVHRQLTMPDGRVRTRVGGGQRDELLGYGRHLITVAHPHLGLMRQRCEQPLRRFNLTACATIFPGRRAGNPGPQGFAGQLHAVTDAEYRNAKSEQAGVTSWCIFRIDAGRPPGENQTAGVVVENSGDGNIVIDDFAVHSLFTHAACNQLGILRAEVEHENALVSYAAARCLRGDCRHFCRRPWSPGPRSPGKPTIIPSRRIRNRRRHPR